MAMPTGNGVHYGDTAYDIRELEQMVVNFRVYELQHLLAYANRCRSGKKPDLLQRALELVRSTKNMAIQQKVRELYRRLSERPQTTTLQLDTVAVAGINGQTGYASTTANYGTVQGTNSSSSSPAPNANPGAQFGSSILQLAQRQNLDLHPRVSLVALPFYDLLAEVVKPTTLVPMNTEKFQDNYITFTLTSHQMSELAFNESAPLPRVELQLRFCLLDTNDEQKDDFPSLCTVRMNEKQVQLPNPIPTNKVGVEPKRPSRPVNVTPYTRTNQSVQRIHVTWNHDGSRHWTSSLYIVRHVTADMLLQRLQAKGERPSNVSISMIKEKLGGDSDNDIAATSIRVSLLCPLGKMRMRLPCRLHRCAHLQCFDGDLFLRMNEKKPTWTCPVCDKTAPFSELQVDGYFLDVIEKTGENECEVEVYEDGGWTPIAEKEEKSGNEKKKSVDQQSEMADSETPSTSSVRAASAETTASTSTVAKPCSTENDLSIIDLTEDDSDEERAVVTGRADSTSSSSGAFGNWRKAIATNGRSRPVVPSSDSQSPSNSPYIIVLDSPSPTPPIGTPEDPRVNANSSRERETTVSSTVDPSTRPMPALQPCSSTGPAQPCDGGVSPPKKRHAGYIDSGVHVQPRVISSSNVSLSRNESSSAFTPSSYLSSATNGSGASSSNQGSSRVNSFGCGIPLLSSVEFRDQCEYGHLLNGVNNRIHHQQHQPGDGNFSGSATANIYGLGSHLAFGNTAASNYLMNSSVFGNLGGYSSIPTDFFSTASGPAAAAFAAAAAAAASNIVPGQHGEPIWDHRWSQDFQDFLNSCLPDSSSGPSSL